MTIFNPFSIYQLQGCFALAGRVLVIAAVLITLGCGNQSQPIIIEGRTMGTTYSVKVVDNIDADGLRADIEHRLELVNNLMSTYIKDSEISRLNQLVPGAAMPLSAPNQLMLDLALKLHAESDAKFDITLGPLISLWGFGADPSRVDVPKQADIDLALGQMGLDALHIENGLVTKHREVAIDFSAIAKGYGVDEIARLVEAAGGNNYLVEIGGELKAKGLNQHGQVWRIGIETPDLQQRVPFAAIPLDNLAMATSGDYRNFFEVDGKRFSHTLDPSTGYPISHDLVSVTVLAETCAEADGYATAVNVMGPVEGMKLADKQKLRVFVILKTDGGFESQTSAAFDEYLAAHARGD